MDKKIVYSGTQPSGNLTLGNYIGALRNFPPLQENYDCIYCIADMHVVTVPQEPKVLRAHSLGIPAPCLVVGIDPDKSTVYIQFRVPAHVELMRFLDTMTGLGQLQRMAQFKPEAEKTNEVNTDLLNYPIFMASGIPLYGTHYISVGDGQKQRIEITRDLAERFNSRYSEAFVLPEMSKAKAGGQVMSLQGPTKKMFRSDADEDSLILILDQDDVIRREFKRAVAGSEGHIAYNDQQAGVKNLLDTCSACSGRAIGDLLKNYGDKGYGVLKEDAVEAVIGEIGSIRNHSHETRSDKTYSGEVYRREVERAPRRASKILRKACKKMDFIPR